MAGMATGGPVKQEHGNPGPMQRRPQELPHLTTFIYDYFLKRKAYGAARALLNSEELKNELSLGNKGRPDLNGADGMDDMKEDLPQPQFNVDQMNNMQGDPFLADWWNIFWDIWNVSRSRTGPPPVSNYFHHSQAAHMSQQLHQPMMPNNMNTIRAMQQNINGMELRKAAVGNAQRNPAMMMRPQGAQPGPMGPHAMQRDGSQIDMGGDRPQSPMSGGDNAPSPKRPRMDAAAAAFNGNGMNPVRPGMPQMNGAGPNGAPNMMQNGFDASNPMAPAAQFAMAAGPGQNPMMGFRGNRPSMGENGMAKGFPSNGMQGPSMLGPDGTLVDGGFMGPNAAGQMRPNPNNQGGPQGGALADYQMQLMLLEQQNKKRLLMARQEQDVANHNQNGATGPMPGQNLLGQAQFAGANPGFSVNAPNGHMNPNAQQLEMARQHSGGRPGQFPPGQGPQMMAGQASGGDAGQRNQMPPPQAPAAANSNNQRPPPESPAQQPNPPTPSQAAKPNPKAKKSGKEADKSKKPAKKGGATGATPSSEADNPPTPTPQTPITPVHPQSFNKPGPMPQTSNPQQNAPPQAGGPQGPGDVQLQSQQAQQQQQPPDGPNNQQPFGGNLNMEQQDDINFGGFDFDMGGENVLEGFDFGSFLHMEDDPSGIAFDPSQFAGGDGVEMGAGQP